MSIAQLVARLDDFFFASPYKKMELRQRAGIHPDMFHWSGEKGKPLSHLALIMLFKDEADIIEQNLLWHYYLGFRRFILMNNGSSDASEDKIKSFQRQKADIELYLIDDPIEAYFQDKKTTAMAKMAEALWQVKWIFPVDADEFLVVQHSMQASLDKLEKQKQNAVLIPLIDFAAQKTPSSVEPLPFYQRLCCYDPQLTKHQSKIAFRPLGDYRLSMGNHKLFGNKRLKMANGLDFGLMYRHFPVRSMAQLKKKVINGGKAYQNTHYSRAIGEQWKQAYQQYLQQGDKAIEQQYRAFVENPLLQAESVFPFEKCL